MQKGAKALILAQLADDLSGDVDQDAITTTYDLFLRDAREKMGMPFYIFACCGFIAALGIYISFPKHIIPVEKIDKAIAKLSYRDKSVWPFLLIAALSSLCQASLLQSIGFFVTDVFSNEKDLPLVISLTFVVLSISTVVSQYIFTDLKPISNNKLLIYIYQLMFQKSLQIVLGQNH